MDWPLRLTALGVLAAAVLLAAWLLRRGARAAAAPTATRFDARDVGLAGAGFVLFTSPYCVPCGELRGELGAVVDGSAALSLREVDARARPDLFRKYGVASAPALFALDAEGRTVFRASGPVSAATLRRLAQRLA